MSALVNQTRSRVPRIAEAAVERARLSVVPRAARRAPRMPFVVLVSLVLVLGIVGLLLFNTSMQQASFRATAMQDRADALAAKAQALQMDLARLRDPQRVAERARHLGMVPPSSPAVLRLSDGKVLGNPEPASSADALRITPLPTRKPLDLRPAPVVVAPPPASDATSGESSQKHGTADQRGAASADKAVQTGTTADKAASQGTEESAGHAKKQARDHGSQR
ncbi:MAG: hypothetical protein ACTHOK_08665 [Nocardioidaceae bacterium]